MATHTVVFSKYVKLKRVDPISTGGGVWNLHPERFSSITQKRENILSWNLVTFFIDKWIRICIIKLEDGPFHVARVMAQIKVFKNDI